MSTINATEFKAKCLEILDRLDAHEIDKLTITKRGRPVAVLTPVEPDADAMWSLNGFMRGSVVIPEGFDLTAPILDEELDAEAGILHR